MTSASVKPTVREYPTSELKWPLARTIFPVEVLTAKTAAAVPSRTALSSPPAAAMAAAAAFARSQTAFISASSIFPSKGLAITSHAPHS